MSDFDFETPTAIASEFASAQSFRGRLVLIEMTDFETNVPNQQDPSKFSDRVTATVTTVDGLGKVQIYSQKAPTGQFLAGPSHEGVWFSQDRIVKAVAFKTVQNSLGEAETVRAPIGRKVLGVIETGLKPGKPAGLGNPWGLIDPTPAQVQTAKDFLAGRTVAEATAPAQAAENDPWAK